jgi:hypothetical protein
LIVTTKKIAAQVRGEETGWETVAAVADGWTLMGSDVMGIQPVKAKKKSPSKKSRPHRRVIGGPSAYQSPRKEVH